MATLVPNSWMKLYILSALFQTREPETLSLSLLINLCLSPYLHISSLVLFLNRSYAFSYFRSCLSSLPLSPHLFCIPACCESVRQQACTRAYVRAKTGMRKEKAWASAQARKWHAGQHMHAVQHRLRTDLDLLLLLLQLLHLPDQGYWTPTGSGTKDNTSTSAPLRSTSDAGNICTLLPGHRRGHWRHLSMLA